jgi:DNA polymerase-3 subunit beta
VLLQAGFEDDVASQRLQTAGPVTTEMTVAFNPVYLMDALSSFADKTVRMALMGPGQRAMITSGEETGPATHQYLLMSVKPPLL